MDAYQKLRQQARLLRDNEIKAAHDKYARTLKSIADLRKTLGAEGSVSPVRKAGTNFAKGQKALELIRRTLPRDHEFTTLELVALLRAAEPSQEIPESSLRAHLRRLEDQRVLSRVRRAGDGQVVWTTVGEGSEPEKPLAAMNLPDAASVVLGESGPMTIKELSIAIQARGCRTDANRRLITESLAAALRSTPTRFWADSTGRWTVSSDYCT